MKAFIPLAVALLLTGISSGCGQNLKNESPIYFADAPNQVYTGEDPMAPFSEWDPVASGDPIVAPTAGASTPAPATTTASTITPTPTPAPATPTPVPSLPAKNVLYRDKVIVLMYHHIAESEAGEEVTITPAKFESHLKVLKDNKYQVISIEDYVHFVKENKAVPPNAVVITFDDGYESYYRYAYPLLKKYGYTATNFVVTSYLDSSNPSLPFMTWKQLKEMKGTGFSFYSHSHNSHARVKGADNQLVAPLAHKIWLEGKNRLESEDEYRKRIRDDLSTANQLLHEKLGNEMNILCFPLGFYNKSVIDIGNEIGIDFFFTTRDGINTRKDKEIYRIHAGTRYMTSDKLSAKMLKFKDTGNNPTK